MGEKRYVYVAGLQRDACGRCCGAWTVNRFKTCCHCELTLVTRLPLLSAVCAAEGVQYLGAVQCYRHGLGCACHLAIGPCGALQTEYPRLVACMLAVLWLRLSLPVNLEVVIATAPCRRGFRAVTVDGYLRGCTGHYKSFVVVIVPAPCSDLVWLPCRGFVA